MRYVLVSLASLLLAVAILMAGSGLLGIVLGVRLALEDIPNQSIGQIMACYFIGLAAGSQLCGGVLARVGHIRAFAAFAALSATAVLLHALWFSPVFWALLRILSGFSMAGLYMVVETWLNGQATRANRGRLFSVYMGINYMGLSLGQFMLTLGDPVGLDLFLLSALLLALCLVPVSLTRTHQPGISSRERLSLLRLFRMSNLGLITAFGAGMVNGSFFALGPVFGIGMHLEVVDVAALMGVAILGGLFLQWPVGQLSDRYDRGKVIAAVAVAMAIVSIGINIVHQIPVVAVLLLAAAFGGLSFAIYPLAVAHTNDHAESDQLISVSAGLLFAWGMGAIIGPLAAGGVMDLAGPRGLFLFTAAVGLLLAALAYLRRGEAVPTEEQGPFQSMPRTTPVIYELDPRADADTTGATDVEGEPRQPPADPQVP